MLDRIKKAFGYDATKTTTRRRAPISDVKSEDDQMTIAERRALVSTTRNLKRNFTLSAWMIRKHLDFVASHSFQSNTKIEALDEQIEKLVRWWGLKENFDISRKHSLHRFIRLGEAARVTDGDFFIWKSRNGYVAGIEGDRIANPTYGSIAGRLTAAQMKNYKRGVKRDAVGRHVSYLLNNRSDNGGMLKFAKVMSARDIIQFAYWDRIDQIRGISPLAAGINSMQDTSEGIGYALARAKVSQLFAFAMKRGSPEAAGEVSGGTDADGDEDKSQFTVDFNKGPIVLDMDPNDEAAFLESKQPSQELQTFLQSVMSLSLKALDIPFSFCDESLTNYSGARQALLLYFQSAKEKQRCVQELLNELTHWRLTLWVLDGIIKLPPGMTVSDVEWEWYPTGMPWIDMAKELIGDTKAVELKVNSRQRIVRRAHGTDWRKIEAELKEEQDIIDKDFPEPEPSEDNNNKSLTGAVSALKDAADLLIIDKEE